MTKTRKRRGSSKAGRPKQPGARYPGGRLKPSGPAARVLEGRRALIGDKKIDIRKASDPVDLAHAHGWLSDADHLTAARLLRLYRLAGFSPPHMGSGALHEAQPAIEIDMRPFSTMPHEEIAEIWDLVFNQEGDLAPAQAESRTKEHNAALGLWRTAMAKMSPAVRREVFDLCINRSWPDWIAGMAASPEGNRQAFPRFQRLMEGLLIARSVLKKPRPARPAVEALVAEPKGQAVRKLVEDLSFVDEVGRPVEMISQHGVPFAVARKVRAHHR